MAGIKAGAPVERVDRRKVRVEKGVQQVIGGATVPSTVHIEWRPGAGVKVFVEATVREGVRPLVTALTVIGGKDGVTSELVRTVPVSSLVNIGLSKAIRGDVYKTWRKNHPPRYEPGKRGRKLTAEHLAHVHEVAALATAIGDDPVEIVAGIYDVPSATAIRWVYVYA